MNLPRKVLGRLLTLARRVPVLRAAEQRRYARCEARLSQPVPPPGPWAGRLLPLPPAPVVRQAIAVNEARAAGRMIDLAAPDAADLACLAAAGLQLACARANSAADPPAALVTTPATSPDPPLTGAAALAFQDVALATGALAAVCPWSGRSLRATRSFIAAQNATIFYRFDAQEVCYLAVGREGRGYVKLYLWLPVRRLALLLAEPYRWHGFAEIEQLRAHLIAEQRPVTRYLRGAQPAGVSALVDNSHFAHHLWNALSGIERLVESGTLAQLDRLICTAEPLGPLDVIFPELVNLRLERHAFPGLIDTALKRHWLLLRPGGNRISPALIRRVQRVASERVPPRTLKAIEALRASHWPILWVTVRVENRTWVRQVEGLIAVARALVQAQPGSALIIDGFSVPHGQPNLAPAHQARLIHQEQTVVALIRAGLGGALPVVSLVGESLFAAIAYAPSADLYLAHHGSVQHKIGWFGHCPGLIHSNRRVLADPRLRDAAMEARVGGIAPVYIDPAVVTDMDGAVPVANNRWPDDLSNYDLEPMVAARTLLGLLPAGPRYTEQL